MKMFSWIIKDTTIDFLKLRRLGYVISAILLAASKASMAI